MSTQTLSNKSPSFGAASSFLKVLSFITLHFARFTLFHHTIQKMLTISGALIINQIYRLNINLTLIFRLIAKTD